MDEQAKVKLLPMTIVLRNADEWSTKMRTVSENHLDRRSLWLAVLMGGILVSVSCNSTIADALERLQLDKLKATHEGVAALRADRRPVRQLSGYEDYRALLHVHSHWSHDSRGTIDDILAAAKATGTRVIMFTEHPADHYDYFTDGHSGLRDGVLLIPGAETGGFLTYPTRSLKGEKTKGSQEFADLVRRDDGLIFLSHLEERMDWDITGLTGVEIYNTHADFKDEKNFQALLRNPLALFGILPAFRQYPQEAFAALQDYPADYLKRWDALCQKSPHTGVAANDSHQNTGVVFRLLEFGKVQFEDALGKKFAELDPAKVDFLKDTVADKKPGDVVFAQHLDRYEYSFGYVSTHLLMKELTREAVWDALKAGRAYVAFDWMADPTGFAFVAARGETSWPMGSEVSGASGVRLRAEAPLAGTIKLVRNGVIAEQFESRTMDVAIKEPGNYRVEVWLKIADELRPWILSNPIYVRESK